MFTEFHFQLGLGLWPLNYRKLLNVETSYSVFHREKDKDIFCIE